MFKEANKMKMKLLDKYSDYRKHRKAHLITFYNSKTKEIYPSIDIDFIVMNDASLNNIYDLEFEYKNGPKGCLLSTLDVNDKVKNDYIQLTNYTCVSKKAFNGFNGNVRIASGGNYQTYYIFFDVANCRLLSTSVMKFRENDFIEYWCKCAFIQLQENLFIKIPYYLNCFTKLKKEYFKLRIFNKLLSNTFKACTQYLDYYKELRYSEIRSFGCDCRDLYKYLNVDLIKEALKNKEALIK